MHPLEVYFSAAGALSGSDQRLIIELVANISPAADVLKRHGLTLADLKNKQKDALWVSAYKEAKAFWDSAPNVRERIRMKAGMLLEDSLEDLLLIIKDPVGNPQNKLEATKQLGVLSGVATAKPVGADVGSGFKLTININDKKGVTLEGTVVEQQQIETD